MDGERNLESVDWSLVYKKLSLAARRRLHSLGMDPGLADHFVHEALMAVWDPNSKRIWDRDRYNLEVFLLFTLRSLIHNEVRKVWRRKALDFKVPLPMGFASADDQVECSQVVRLLEARVADRPELALMLKELLSGNIAVPSLAESLGVSAQKVYRLRAKLRKELLEVLGREDREHDDG